jgi:3-hydroxyisobutyrate dehydrogenase-like beta-hydroxyacid dehydrogenase
VTGADAVIVMVATPDQLHQALFGPRGAAAGLPHGAVFVVMSTVGVEAVSAAAARLATSSAQLIDAPVTGGVSRARTGELVIFAGGDADAVVRVQPIFAVLGKRVVMCGPRVGDGQAFKLVNQLLCSVHLVAAAEALAFAERLGLDSAQVLEAVGDGAAGSFMLNDRGPRMLAADTPPVLSSINIFVKDSGLVLDAARECGAEVPVLTAAAHQFLAAARDGLGSADDSSVIETLRDRDRAGMSERR